MMYQNKDLPMGVEESRLITFTAPGGLDTNVLGVDSQTGETFLNLATINSIVRAIEDLAQGDARAYEYDITRDGYLIRTVRSDQVKAELQGPVWPGFPLNLSDGTYQVNMRQVTLGGGLAARELNIIFQKSLA